VINPDVALDAATSECVPIGICAQESPAEAKSAAIQICARFVPTLADLAVLADLVRRKNSKLRAFNGGGGTDSVPGHHSSPSQFHGLVRTAQCSRILERVTIPAVTRLDRRRA